MQPKEIKIIYYDDNQDLINGIRFLLNTIPEFKLLATFNNAETIKIDVEELHPDVILMDIDMPGINGVNAVSIVKTLFPEVHIIMFTVFEDEEKIFQSISNGANGYLLKSSSPDEIVSGIFNVVEGGSPLTSKIARKVLSHFQSAPKLKQPNYKLSARELEIIKCLVNGYSYKIIASELF